MKISIPDSVAKNAGLSKEIEAKINAAIKKLESEYVIYLDSIEGEKLNNSDLFLTGGYLDNTGVLKHGIILNYRNYRKTTVG